MTFGHESPDRALQKCRRSGTAPLVRLPERSHQLLRYDEVAKPQARKQNFAEASGVEHAFVAIDALECRQRPAHVAEFAVVIVLDDKGSRLARPRQQRKAPRQGKRDPEGTLMRWRHDREASVT